MRIGLINTGYRVNSCEHELGQGILMRNFDDGEDVGLSPAGVNLFDFFNVSEGFLFISRLAGLHFDQLVRSVRHAGDLP